MALPGDITTAVKFDLTTSPYSFKIDDITDYAGDSISPNDVRGVFKITDPIGNIIHNNINFASPDILGSSTLQYSGLPIPLDINSKVIQGKYLFDYSIVTDYPIIALNQGAKTFTVLGNRSAASGTITVVRSTTGNNATYTLVSAVFGGTNTVFTVSEVIPSAGTTGSIQFDQQPVFSATQANATYSDVIPPVVIETDVDCFCGRLQSTDETNYPSTAIINSRTHKVFYPAALNITPITSSNAIVIVSPIYTNTWTSTITTDLTITNADGSTIDVIITGSEEFVVDCDLSLCQISCCLMALNNRYLNDKTSNPVKAAVYLAQLNRAFQLVELFRLNQQCGNETAAANQLTELRQVANCTSGCGCSDNSIPQIIVPTCGSGGSGSTTVVTAGTGITVTTTVNGNIVTYSVKIADSVMAIINSLAPVNVVGGTGITVVKTVVGGVDTYTVTNTAPFVPLNTQEAQCLLAWSNFANPTLTITTSNIVREGSNMTDMTVANTTGTIGVGTWKFLNNLFTVSGFQSSANSTFKPFVSAILLETQDINGNVVVQANQNTNAAPFDIRILDILSGSFKFQFVDKPSGDPLTNAAMVYSYKVLVNILIKQ